MPEGHKFQWAITQVSCMSGVAEETLNGVCDVANANHNLSTLYIVLITETIYTQSKKTPPLVGGPILSEMIPVQTLVSCSFSTAILLVSSFQKPLIYDVGVTGLSSM
jgi:hypothetical protein